MPNLTHTSKKYAYKLAVLLTVLTMLAALAGCSVVGPIWDTIADKISGGKITEKINAVSGPWKVTNIIVDGRRLTPEEIDRALGSTYYEFRTDKTLLINSPKRPQVGTWRPSSGNAYTINLDGREIEFVPDGTTILLTDGGIFTELSRDADYVPVTQENTESTVKPSPAPDASESAAPTAEPSPSAGATGSIPPAGA